MAQESGDQLQMNENMDTCDTSSDPENSIADRLSTITRKFLAGRNNQQQFFNMDPLDSDDGWQPACDLSQYETRTNNHNQFRDYINSETTSRGFKIFLNNFAKNEANVFKAVTREAAFEYSLLPFKKKKMFREAYDACCCCKPRPPSCYPACPPCWPMQRVPYHKPGYIPTPCCPKPCCRKPSCCLKRQGTNATGERSASQSKTNIMQDSEFRSFLRNFAEENPHLREEKLFQRAKVIYAKRKRYNMLRNAIEESRQNMGLKKMENRDGGNENGNSEESSCEPGWDGNRKMAGESEESSSIEVEQPCTSKQCRPNKRGRY